MPNDPEDPGTLVDFTLSGKCVSADVTHSKIPFSDTISHVKPKYFYIEDIDTEVFAYLDIAVRITDDDLCTVTFVARQKKKFYTHLRNRTAWTGPVPSLLLFDRGRVPIGDIFQMRQINSICAQRDMRVIESKKISLAFSLASYCEITFTPYRYWLC